MRRRKLGESGLLVLYGSESYADGSRDGTGGLAGAGREVARVGGTYVAGFRRHGTGGSSGVLSFGPNPVGGRPPPLEKLMALVPLGVGGHDLTEGVRKMDGRRLVGVIGSLGGVDGSTPRGGGLASSLLDGADLRSFLRTLGVLARDMFRQLPLWSCIGKGMLLELP